MKTSTASIELGPGPLSPEVACAKMCPWHSQRKRWSTGKPVQTFQVNWLMPLLTFHEQQASNSWPVGRRIIITQSFSFHSLWWLPITDTVPAAVNINPDTLGRSSKMGNGSIVRRKNDSVANLALLFWGCLCDKYGDCPGFTCDWSPWAFLPRAANSHLQSGRHPRGDLGASMPPQGIALALPSQLVQYRKIGLASLDHLDFLIIII